MKKSKKKIIFAGSGYLAVPQIKILSNDYNLKIITQKNDNLVKKEFVNSELKIHEVSNSLELDSLLEKLKPEYLIVSDFGIILSKKSLSIPKLVLNTHPSLLPKYRGPSPYVTALLNGDKETGVSLIKMAGKVDSGPIFTQVNLNISKNETSESLRKKLGELAGKVLAIKLDKIMAGKIKTIPQNEKEATFTKQFKKDDGKINWLDTAESIERKVRAFNPWPGTFTFLKLKNGKNLRVKILDAEVEKSNDTKPGKIKIEDKLLKISTKKNYLVIKKIQPEGKKEMNIAEFLSGYKILDIGQ